GLTILHDLVDTKSPAFLVGLHHFWNMPDRSDARIAWIQQRLLLGLGLEETEFDYLFEGPRAKPNASGSDLAVVPRAEDTLRDFLGTAGVGSSLFFHVETEDVEESEEYHEEYQESEAVLEGNQAVSEAPSLPEGKGIAVEQRSIPSDGKPTDPTESPSEDPAVATVEGSDALDAASAEEP
ncbi:unnamed protein product, partial [Ectocarpus sp. 12 AP-2014]